jgi:hypothetical protein
MFNAIPNAGIFKDDLIIAFNSKQISKNKKILTTDNCGIYLKDESGYHQIGLVQDLKVTANSKNAIADISIAFPKKVSKHIMHNLNKNKKDLTALGVEVK